MKSLVRFAATLGPVGYVPIAPATAASAVVVVVGWFLPVPPIAIALTLLGVGTVLAIWLCGEAEKDLGHDAHPIVADEVIGQTLALLWAPHVWWAFALSFLFFRLFDVWKPLGAHQAQRLPGGFGVVADDVIAGLTAFVVLRVGIGLVSGLGS